VPSGVSTGRIKGPEGTEVELRVIPVGGGEPRELVLERAGVRLPAVTASGLRKIDGREVAYVRFSTFSEGSHGELRQEIERLERKGAEGLVLDLRANGGGLLNEAVLSASVFVDEGTVVSTESRTQGDRSYEAVGDALEPRPTVVLVDRDTASAAEILAAALETYDLATVVGTRTYGKGTFQEVIPLDAGGALDLTIGQYLTADGTSIAGEGVRPEVRVADDPATEGSDEALDEALQVLAGQL
jgi:carboxyl-terminal processing protease